MRAVRPVRNRLTAGLAALAVGAVLAGCGSEEPQATDEPTSAASGSSDSPSEESSETPSESSDESASQEPSPIDDGAPIDVDQFVQRLQAGIDRTEQAHIEFTMSGTGAEMKGDGDLDYTAETPNMSMTMKIGPETLGMLLVDGTMYVQSSQAGDKYLAYDLDDPNNPLGSGFSEQLDPASSIKAFAEALSSVTSSGAEDVDGQSLERYNLTVDTTQLEGQQSTAGLPEEMQVVVWLDDQDRMAKTSMGLGAIQYDATLSDFDKPVRLQAPPADQIMKSPAAG